MNTACFGNVNRDLTALISLAFLLKTLLREPAKLPFFMCALVACTLHDVLAFPAFSHVQLMIDRLPISIHKYSRKDGSDYITTVSAISMDKETAQLHKACRLFSANLTTCHYKANVCLYHGVDQLRSIKWMGIQFPGGFFRRLSDAQGPNIFVVAVVLSHVWFIYTLIVHCFNRD